MRNRAQALPIRIGMVGMGNWAADGHVRVLNLLPEYKLSVLYSQRAEAGAAAAATHGFAHVVSSLDELLKHPEVDLVVIATTAPQHEQAIRAAIRAGKDVYCEWPLTTSAATSEEMAHLAEAAGVRTMVGLQRRLAPHNRYLKDLLAEGYVGHLRSARIHVSMNYFQPRIPRALRWTAPPENFSSMVAIYVGHFLDMLFDATGWPTEVSALAVNHFPTVTVIETGEEIPTTNADEFVMNASLPGGAVVLAHFEGGKRNGSGVQIDITGTAGDIRIVNTSAFGGVGEDYVVTGAHGNMQPLSPLPLPPRYDTLPHAGLPSAVMELAENYAAFARDVATGTHNAPTFRDAVRMHRLIDAALESSETGRWQPLMQTHRRLT
jgi:predicted dehydrogenase